jgi:hypothetical protein
MFDLFTKFWKNDSPLVSFLSFFIRARCTLAVREVGVECPCRHVGRRTAFSAHSVPFCYFLPKTQT